MKYGATIVYRLSHAETGELLYIGMTSNLPKRIAAHTHRYHGTPLKVKTSKPMAHHLAADLERSLIRKLNPRDNIVHTPKHGPICEAARATWVATSWGKPSLRKDTATRWGVTAVQEYRGEQ